MIRVLIADDHELVRSGIQYILDADPRIAVVGLAGSGEEALIRVDELRPEIVLMDIHMPGIGGLQASQRLRQEYPDIKIIGLSVCNDGPLPRSLLKAGIHGYISKNCPPDEMITAIMTVYEGQSYLSSDVAEHLSASDCKKTGFPFDQLSCREMEVVVMTLQGKPIQSIAAALKVSPKTVCTYRYRVFDKLGVDNDVELTRLATKYNLLNGILS
ncbi:MAG: response regulator [Methylohalobius sp. ZOD2]